MSMSILAAELLRRWPVSWPFVVTIYTVGSDSSGRGANSREASLCIGLEQHCVLLQKMYSIAFLQFVAMPAGSIHTAL